MRDTYTHGSARTICFVDVVLYTCHHGFWRCQFRHDFDIPAHAYASFICNNVQGIFAHLFITMFVCRFLFERLDIERLK